jgi:CTP:molybdopterin cytidylyltransferase MocA
VLRARYAGDIVTSRPVLAGLVLAAGAGERFGGPKALARRTDGTPWLAIAVDLLRAGGCDPVLVALGAGADAAAPLVPPGAVVVLVEDWAQGLSATLRAGLDAVTVDAVVVMPVDTPDADIRAIGRVIAAVREEPRTALVQATYSGSPGHPVLIGRDHFPALISGLTGDRGAGEYLAQRGAVAVECGDLWSGADIDVRRVARPPARGEDYGAG